MKERGRYTLPIFRTNLDHTNSQDKFQEVVNKEMTVCEYRL